MTPGEIPPNTDINAWAERNRLSGEYLPRIATATGAHRLELICELAAKLFASWARRRVSLVRSLDDIPAFDLDQGTHLSLIVLPQLSGVPLDDQDMAAIRVTMAGCRRTWLGRAIERTQPDDPERPALLSVSAWSRAKALDSSFKTHLTQGRERDHVVAEHMQRCFDALAEEHIDEGLALDYTTLHQTIPQATHAIALKLGWLSSGVEWELTIVQEWLSRLFGARAAYFEACRIGRPFGHQHEKPPFVYESIPETDPLMQTVLLHDGFKRLNATQPFVVPEEVVRLGVEARGIPRGSPEFEEEFLQACTDLAARHKRVRLVMTPTVPPEGQRKGAEPTPEFQPQQWSELQITFLSDDRIEIRIGENTETRNCAEFGFARNNGRPKLAWETLRDMARRKGIVQIAADSRQWADTEKRIQEIRKVLRTKYGVADDPIPYRKKTRRNPADFGYHAQFKLRCHPSYDT